MRNIRLVSRQAGPSKGTRLLSRFLAVIAAAAVIAATAIVAAAAIAEAVAAAEAGQQQNPDQPFAAVIIVVAATAAAVVATADAVSVSAE